MSERQRLPNRRACETFALQCGPHRYVATISFFPGTDRLAEIFIGNGRAGDTAAKDAAVVASIALQYGVPHDVLRRALMRDAQGGACGPLAVALDRLATFDREVT
jgi:hypothetical protein